MQFHLTGGQVHVTQALDELLDRTDEAVVDLDNHKVAWPLALAGDKGYRADWIDKLLLELDILPVIPSKDSDNRDERGVAFDRDLYRNRNIIERLIGWLKESRRIFSRFEKTAINFGGMIKLAFIQRYLRLMTGTFETKPRLEVPAPVDVNLFGHIVSVIILTAQRG